MSLKSVEVDTKSNRVNLIISLKSRDYQISLTTDMVHYRGGGCHCTLYSDITYKITEIRSLTEKERVLLPWGVTVSNTELGDNLTDAREWIHGPSNIPGYSAGWTDEEGTKIRDALSELAINNLLETAAPLIVISAPVNYMTGKGWTQDLAHYDWRRLFGTPSVMGYILRKQIGTATLSHLVVNPLHNALLDCSLCAVLVWTPPCHSDYIWGRAHYGTVDQKITKSSIVKEVRDFIEPSWDDIAVARSNPSSTKRLKKQKNKITRG